MIVGTVKKITKSSIVVELDVLTLPTRKGKLPKYILINEESIEWQT